MVGIPVSFFNHKKDNQPRAAVMTWPQLRELLTAHDMRPHKDGPLFSPTQYRPGATRGNMGVESLSMAVLDFDDSITLDALTARCDGLAAIIYSTFNHTPEAEKYRVCVPLRVPVAGEDWPLMWQRINAFFGGAVDIATKDAARISYLPACPPESHPIALVLRGKALNADWLPTVEVAPERAPFVPPPAPPSNCSAYVRGALKRESEKVKTAPDKTKHSQLLRSAIALSGFIWTGQISANDIEDALFYAVAQRAADRQQAQKTIRDGIKYGECRPLQIPPPRGARSYR